jgi:hypothetical protein
MLCYAMLCYAMLCYAMPCYAMPCYAMLCHAMLRYAMLCYAARFFRRSVEQGGAGVLKRCCEALVHHGLHRLHLLNRRLVRALSPATALVALVAAPLALDLA